MKKINKLVQLCIIILCISALNAFADNNNNGAEIQATCCDYLEIEARPVANDPCCMEVLVFNPYCIDLVVIIDKKVNDNMINVVTETIDRNDSLVTKFKVCGEEDESSIEVHLHLRDVNGNYFCNTSVPMDYVFTQEVKCCECPENIDDYFSLEVIPDACPKGCKVIHKIDIPKEYHKCFKKMIFQNSQAFTSGVSMPIEDANNEFNKFETCISKYGSYTATITLISNNGQECEYKKTVFCDGDTIDSKKLCVPDCENSPWKPVASENFDLPECPGCKVNVAYTWRKACGIWQDLQIARITLLTDECNYCDMESIYAMVLNAVIAKNTMKFRPLDKGECSTIWRIANGACWAEWDYYPTLMNSKNRYKGFEPCSDIKCCLQPMEVCIDSNDKYTVTPIGTGEYYGENCDSIKYKTWFGEVINCFPACDWLANYKGINEYPMYKKVDNSIRIDYEKSYAINTGIQNDIISVLIRTPKAGKAEIKVYDVSGREIINESSEINTGTTNALQVGIGSLQSGNYIYTVTIDGITLKSQKFNINK